MSISSWMWIHEKKVSIKPKKPLTKTINVRAQNVIFEFALRLHPYLYFYLIFRLCKYHTIHRCKVYLWDNGQVLRYWQYIRYAVMLLYRSTTHWRQISYFHCVIGYYLFFRAWRWCTIDAGTSWEAFSYIHCETRIPQVLFRFI